MYYPSKALRRIAKLRKQTRVIQGGQGAGKTIGIIIILINHCLHKDNREVTIIQAELTKLKKTAMLDFLKIMKAYDLMDIGVWNKSDSIYRFKNGSFIEFLGMDKADVGKGFRRNILYFNEINKGGITLDAYVQFASRADIVYSDFNPDRKFWIHEEVIPDKDTDFITLTFKDNQFIPVKEKSEILKYRDKGFHAWVNKSNSELFKDSNIKSKYWANKWRVYGLGLVGSLDGVIFTNWKEIHSVPKDAKYIGTGLDFGYSNDPTAIVDVYEMDGKRILDEVCYRTRLVNNDVARYLKSKGIVYADSAEPKSIEEIRRTGVDIRGATKGKDSIIYGINTMQDQEYLVTKRSINLKMELESYTWSIDRDGNTINKPIDNFNHLLDALRYHEMENIGINQGFFTF